MHIQSTKHGTRWRKSMGRHIGLTVFALRATVHTMMQCTPAQLVFGGNSIVNWSHDVDWEIARKQKQDLINKGNKCDNRNQRNHTYKQEDKVLLKNLRKTKFNQDAYLSPYVITAVRKNGTVRANKDGVTDTFNILYLTPYKE